MFCGRCIRACPTGALSFDGFFDARKCISYLTIEFRGVIPRELRPAMGQWLFGCDLCQTCCPFEVNSGAGSAVEFEPGEVLEMNLTGLLSMDDDEFRSRFRRTPLWRPRREGLLRNAVIVTANGEHIDALPAVCALLGDESPILREVASWCIARIGDDPARSRLQTALESESDPDVAAWMRADLR